MPILFTKEEAIDSLPFIPDEKLFKAVNLALWLYLDKRWNLKASIDKAAEKHSYRPKLRIEQMMREAIPEEVFEDRKSTTVPTGKPPAKKVEEIVTSQKIKQLDTDNKQHVSDITKEDAN